MGQMVLWRRLDQPGHDWARLFFEHTHWHLTGTAMFVHEQQPCRLDYLVVCDSDWRALSARVSGWVGDRAVQFDLTVGTLHRWRLNGAERPEVMGCMDVDLGFSPSTNLLPIRRLGLAVGQSAEVRAAWFRFPDFTLEPLPQIYRRTDETTYHYELADGTFAATLQVNETGFVTDYSNLWTLDAAT